MSELIDREALMNELWKQRRNYQMMDDTQTADKIMYGLYRAEQVVKEAPAVNAAPRWVRCEERLPKKTWKFVVWVPVNNGPYPCWCEERTALWQAVEKKWYVDHNPKTWWVGEPTHWMPIEPPKEVQDG